MEKVKVGGKTKINPVKQKANERISKPCNILQK